MRRSITRPGKRWFKRALEAGLTFLFPPRCAGCGEMGAVWCAHCESRLIKTFSKGCLQCDFPLLMRNRCPACELGNLQLRSYARYRPPLKQAILRLKYAPNQALASVMAAWLTDLYHPESDLADMILPVPLGDVRRRERGYNQVELIASAMARDLNLPVQPQSLVRVHETRSQVGLDPEERFENVDRAFAAVSKHIHNRNILLLDDLVTSGATLIGCASALFDAGASKVICLTVGRTSG